MKDYISRQEIINTLLEELKDKSLYNDNEVPIQFAIGFDEGIRSALISIVQLPAANVKDNITEYW